MTQRNKLAVLLAVVNKIAEDDTESWERTATEFENVEMTISELADHINRGHAFCVQHQGRRREKHFLCSDILTVDIDNGWRVEDALTDGFVQQQAAMLYTTPSHTEAEHRLRIVFRLPRTITNIAEMRTAYTGIIRKFGGDGACKDACHFFFGSKDSNPIVFDNVMSNEALEEILILGREEKLSDSKRNADGIAVASGPATRRSEISLAVDQQVSLKNGRIMPVADLPHYTPVHCPVHVDRHASAFVVRSQSGVAGVHCRKCNATFWPPSMKRRSNVIDFYQVEGIVADKEYEEDPDHLGEGAPEGFVKLAEVDRSHFTFGSKYLAHLDTTPFDGVTFVRSPKGSGKTEWLVKIVQRCKDEGKSVLLFGHRRTLISSMAERLGLTCYYYREGGKLRNELPDSHYTVCLDSVGKLLNTEFHKYDVVIIDESEQVLSHLTGDTMRGKRRECALKLFHYLRSAKSVIMSDADLGQITVNAVFQSVNADTPYRFYVNTYRESRCPVYFYEDDGQLTEEMVQTVKAGGRHYVTTNSKNKAEVLDELLRREFGNARRVLLVTSDTVSDPDVMKFINGVKSEFLNYDVVIASPTMGTGIDITFPNDAQFVDNVFGFFEARVNTHFDIDQQIARVRHPKAIRVWVAPQQFSFETDPNVIRQEAKDNGALSDALLRIHPDGTLEVDETYLSVYANVVSVSRASKNRLRKNLHELRVRNGWQVETVKPAPGSGVLTGKEKMDAAKIAVVARRNAALCAATQIDHDRYRVLSERSSAGMVIRKDDELSMRRYEIEVFYRTNVTPDLVMLDERGAYREKVRLMQVYLTPLAHLEARARAEHDAQYMATDRSHEPLKKLLLHELLSAAGIADDVTPIKQNVRVSQETLGRFAEVCQSKASKIQELFGISVRRDVSKKAARQLSDILDLMGLSFGDTIRQKRDGVTTNIYPLDEASWETVKNIVDRRMSSAAQKSVPTLQFETDTQRAKRKKKEQEAMLRKRKRGYVAVEY
ncbi:plasmid replication protein, CyRepA1 family [Paraburkholderia sp. RL17-337-BIB-A]|uniref:plasmid replication protein, CyRepA1 family n=1 Tax=Paraburkholderia sp. RL17-337-BIB-A TaxID=3031636 RepID=UPI0038B8A8FE